MDAAWEYGFRERMSSFESRRPPREDEFSVSLKVRVTSGCFHREHSPHAYQLIDRHLESLPPSDTVDFQLVEHESGPEILVYLTLTATGLQLTKSIIDLIVAIIRARSEGVQRGDQRTEPVEVIVRRIVDGDKFQEETVFRIGHGDSVSRADLEIKLKAALKRLSAKTPALPGKPQKKGSRKGRGSS